MSFSEAQKSTQGNLGMEQLLGEDNFIPQKLKSRVRPVYGIVGVVIKWDTEEHVWS